MKVAVIAIRVMVSMQNNEHPLLLPARTSRAPIDCYGTATSDLRSEADIIRQSNLSAFVPDLWGPDYRAPGWQIKAIWSAIQMTAKWREIRPFLCVPSHEDDPHVIFDAFTATNKTPH